MFLNKAAPGPGIEVPCNTMARRGELFTPGNNTIFFTVLCTEGKKKEKNLFTLADIEGKKEKKLVVS